MLIYLSTLFGLETSEVMNIILLLKKKKVFASLTCLITFCIYSQFEISNFFLLQSSSKVYLQSETNVCFFFRKKTNSTKSFIFINFQS